MSTRSGVGTSANRDSVAAGSEAALEAREQLDGRVPSLVLVFATAGHDQQLLIDGVTKVFAGVPLSGCSTEGIITRAGSAECSHAIAVMAIVSDELRFTTYSVPHFSEDSAAAGRQLAREIRKHRDGGKLLWLFPDGIAGNCTELLRAIEAEMPSPLTIAGGTAGDLLNFQKTFQYHDGRVHTDSVSAVLVGGQFDAEIVMTHGCDLVGLPRTITRADRGFVYTIDDQSAWQLFKGYLDSDTESLEALHVAHLLLAEHLPVPPSGLFDDFTVRVPVKLDKETGALYFAAGLTTGTRVQIALRNADKVCERAEQAARELKARRTDQQPLLVLQFDCAGRGRLLLGDRVTERLTAPVIRVFDEKVPWIGMHTYGEISPVDQRTYFHNYTAVLCAIYASQA